MKVSIIGTNGLPCRYGGWDNLLYQFTSRYSDCINFVVYTSVYDVEEKIEFYNGASIKYINLKANGYQSVLYDIFGMVDAVFSKSDVLLVLGTSGCIFFPILKLFRFKTVLNPDGAEWKRSKWSWFPRAYLKFSEYLGVKFATHVIADNKVIQNELLHSYGIKSTLIEYGADHVIPCRLNNSEKLPYGLCVNGYAFKVCRIVPENNIDVILEAFAEVGMKLVLVGNWNFSDYGKSLRGKFSDFNNLLLLDPIYDQAKLDLLRSNCAIYIHGHSVGGTNPSLVEAMYLGLCCVVFDADYNRETTSNSAIYFQSKDQLIKEIVKINKLPGGYASVGDNLQRVAQDRYRWSDICLKYKNVITCVANV